MLTEKVKELQIKCLERGKNPPYGYMAYDFNKAALGQFKDLPHWEKAALSMAWAITHQKVYVYPEDNLAGRYYHCKVYPPEEISNEFEYYIETIYPNARQLDRNNGFTQPAVKRAREEFDHYDELIEHQLVGRGALGHIVWDYNLILTKGVEGLRKDYVCALQTARDEQAEEFYKGVIILLDAMLEWNDLHVAELEKMGKKELANICRKVPRYAPESFHEAVQAYFMQYVVVFMENPYGGNSPGRIDYYLWPYLEKDLEKGLITMEEANDLVAELFLRINERLGMDRFDAWVESAVVGGSNPDGSSSVNPLTYIMIELATELDITHPNIYVRMPENPPQELITATAKYLREGRNKCQLFSDPAIVKALMYRGVPYEEAQSYVSGGCMEVSVAGKTSDFLWIGWQNVPKMLELMITGGLELNTGKRIEGFHATKGLTAYSDFESFYQDFIAEVGRLTTIFLKAQDYMSEDTEYMRPAYLISSMLHDCLERGRNQHAGGAVYHDYGGAHLGMPNTADGLNCIKKAVFDEKWCTAQELVDALWADFKGYERLQAKLAAIPKYGCEDPQADAMAARVMGDMFDMYNNYTTRWGGKGRPIELTFWYTPYAASELGATPDGGNAKRNIAQSVTPQSGAQTRGLTAAMNSCSSMPFEKCTGAGSAMWDMEKSWASQEVVESIVRAFVEGGSQIFQGNVTSVAELRDAQLHPENYPHLCVRVGGYSAHWVTLRPELQEDIITRIMHTC